MDLPQLPWGPPEITRILPHRPPFLLVDRVLGVEPDQRIVGEKLWVQDGALHHDVAGRPLVPASLVMEAMAQLGAILILLEPDKRGRIIYFMGIERVRYRSPVRPGDTLAMEARVVRLRSRVGTLRGSALVGGRRVADGTMHFALGELA